MRYTRFAALGLVLLLSTACATTTSRPVRSEFEDLPVPKGLAYRESGSVIIESPQVKAARLLYRGRIEPTSLAAALRATLEANGWRHVSSTSGTEGTLQVYEKAGDSLQVRIWEGWVYTYAEYTRTLTKSAKTAAN